MAKTEESDHIYCFHLGVKKAYSIAYQGNTENENACLVSKTLHCIIERFFDRAPIAGDGTENKARLRVAGFPRNISKYPQACLPDG